MMTVGAVSQADCSMRAAQIVACTAQPVEKLMTIAASGQRLAGVVQTDTAVLGR